jgi:hypothetical protein
MKWVIALLLLSVSSSVYAEIQKPETPSTKVESLSIKKGRLLSKEYVLIGEVRGTYGTFSTIKTIVIKDETNTLPDTIKGIQIYVEESGALRKSNTVFLDEEEMGSLVKALDNMINKIDSAAETTPEYNEYVYNGKDNFTIGFYQNKEKQTGFISAGMIGKASCYFSIDKIAQIKKVIEDAAVSLSGKK